MLYKAKYLQKVFAICREIVYNKLVNFDFGGFMKKRYNLLLTLCSFLLFGLIVFGIGPLKIYVETDIVYGDTVLPLLLQLAITIAQFAAFLISYSVIFYSGHKFGVKQIKNQIIIFLGAVVFFYVGNTLVSYFTDPYFDPVQLIYVVESVALELILHGVIIGYGLHTVNKIADERCLPFERLVSLENPLQKVIAVSSLVLSGSKILSRIIYDVQIGAPETQEEILEMAVYYASDILVGIVSYLIMTYLMISFYSHDKKEKADA